MIHVPTIYSLPRERVVFDGDHVALPFDPPDTMPKRVIVDVEGAGQFKAERDGPILSAPRLGERVSQLGGLAQVELRGDALFFRSALSQGGKPIAAAGELSLEDPSALLRRVSRGEFAPRERFLLSLETSELSIKPGFDQLLSLRAAQGVTPYPHQLNTVNLVLRHMRGRALLCDEVGLGKTVEAGLILMEYLLRGLVKRVLVLTPPSVMYQWREEMAQKFNLDFTLSESPEFRTAGPEAWSRFDRIIASLSMAKRGEHLTRVQDTPFDMVIVDEAHHLRNRATLAWKLVNGLDKKYILLLTATPVQNDLEDLFNLITLLRPGQLKTDAEFRKRFVSRGDPLKPQNVDELKRLVGQVMVRNRRSSAGIAFTHRHAVTVRVEPSPEEVRLREICTGLVRELYPKLSQRALPSAKAFQLPLGVGANERHSEEGGEGASAFGLNRLTLKTLQQALGSSPAAVSSTMGRLLSRPLPEPVESRLRAGVEVAQTAPCSKLGALHRTLDQFPKGEKVIIFTRYLSTLSWLGRELDGRALEVYHGGLSARDKDGAIERFRGGGQVLLSTDAGGEGRNLQFCNLLVNFDLPWNPMRIEQRIGRLSRIGQPRDVHIFNLSVAGSVDDQVLEVLDRKINLFELVIGELDLILGRMEEGDNLEEIIMEMVGTSQSDDDLRARMDALGERLTGLKDDYLRVKAVDDVLFEEVGNGERS